MNISCDKATEICDKSQYGEVTLLERLKLGFHLFLCKKCGLYSKQNGIMSKCYKNQKIFEGQKKCCLSENDKKEMDTNLKAKK